jgi:hypothetical protein
MDGEFTMSKENKGKRLYIRPPKEIFESEEAIQEWATQVWSAFTGLEPESDSATDSATRIKDPETEGDTSR